MVKKKNWVVQRPCTFIPVTFWQKEQIVCLEGKLGRQIRARYWLTPKVGLRHLGFIL